MLIQSSGPRIENLPRCEMPATPPLSYCKRILALVVVSTALSALGFAQHYTRTDLTANIAAPGIKPDANLVNAWGLARGSGSPFWISDNGTGLTTLYDGTGAPQPLVVTIPGLNGQPSAPTGAVFNYSTGFKLANGNAPFFIFVTEDGT